jgi:antitoxin ParD1/3/4
MEDGGSRYNWAYRSPHHSQGAPMQLTLTPEQAAFIQHELTIGHYANANELVTEAFQLLANRRRHDEWEQDVKEKVAIAAAELARGEGVDGETAIAALKARLHQRHQA